MGLSLGGALGIGLGSSLLSGIVNSVGSNAAVNKQAELSRQLWDYQWKKAYSPQAQVKNLTSAGLNPAAAMGNSSPVMSSGGSMSMPDAPNYNLLPGTQSLSDLAQYIAASAQDKKTGAEVPNINQDTEIKKIQADREAFQNKILQTYGLQKSAADLALAEQNVRLARLAEDNNKLDMAIKEWTKAKEKAVSECNEAQRDILFKELANKDIELNIRNRQGEANIKKTGSEAAANYAAAEASRASASKMYSEKDYQDMVNFIKKGSLNAELESVLSEYAEKSQENKAKTEQFKTMLHRYETLNKNNENGAADYLNYILWFVKEQMPSLPIVPFLKLGR